MGSVLRTSQAEVDLLEAWSFIAEDNLEAADRLMDLIDQKCQMLANAPLLGVARRDLSSEFRSFPVRNYLIFYLPTNEGITVLRVLHGARDLPANFP